jgi:hypothetical protein
VPLIQIDLDRALFNNKGDGIDNAVRTAVSEILGSPENEIVVLFSPYDGATDPTRFNPSVASEGQIILAITMVRFFSVDAKLELYFRILTGLADLGIRPEDVHIPVLENGAEDSYLPAA